MSAYQLNRLIALVTESKISHLWIECIYIPQLADDKMKYINVSFDAYSYAHKVAFIPRIKELKRRGWTRVSRQISNLAIAAIQEATERVLSFSSFTEGFSKIIRGSERAKI